MDAVLQEMLRESKEIGQDIREHVILSGMCKGCGMPNIYDTESIDGLIFFNRDIRRLLFERSEDDVYKILTAFGQSLEATKNNPFDACILMLDKLAEYKIDF